MPPSPANIKDLTREEFEADLAAMGQPRYRAKQIFAWLYSRAVRGFEEMTDLPADLRTQLSGNYSLGTADSAPGELNSADGTRKFAVTLSDGAIVETAVIPARTGHTAVCLSTQAGCRYGCRFCASGLGGFARNLSSGEILEQFLFLKRSLPEQRITHVVFMGVGEPLDNYDQTLRAVRMINAPDVCGIAARRITISTCGVIPGIRKLANEGMQFELSVSLHAADQNTRTHIMPVNRKYRVDDLIAACRDYTAATNRIITFEYILLDGLNTSATDADSLADLLDGLKCKVNLIPCNRVADLGCQGVTLREARQFSERLRRCGLAVTVRTPRGRDIDAACGQLRWAAGNAAAQ